MNWYVYIAEARTGAYYVGITTDPNERIKKHNRGDGSRMATQHGGFELRYVSDSFETKSAARTREAQLKGWSRQKKLKLITGEFK